MAIVKKDPDLGVCVELGCKKKQERLHFCEPHFDEFKFGTIKMDGTYPIDRDRKLMQYAKHLKKIK